PAAKPTSAPKPNVSSAAASAPKPAAPIMIPNIPSAAPAPKPAAPINVPKAPKPKPPLATPIVAPPAAPAVAVAVPSPTAAPGKDSSQSDGDYFNPEIGADAAPLVRSSRVKKGFNWLRLLIILFAIGFAASVVITAGGL